jgi:hypothetical protein
MLARTLRGLLFTGVLTLLAAPVPGAAQEPAQPPPAAVDIEVEPERVIAPSVQDKLKLLLESIERKQRQLETERAQRGKEPNPDLDAEIERTKQELDDLRQQFLELATDDFNIARYDEQPQFDIKWQEDLIQVIYPLLRELKELTEKPRAIERLNAELAFYREHAADMEKALAHLDTVVANTKDRKLLRSLQGLQTKATERQQELQQKLSGLELRLQDRMEDKTPLWPSIADGASTFATGLGLHLMLALLLAVAAFYLIQLLGHQPLKLIAPNHAERLVFVERSVHFLARAFGVVFGAIVFLMVLYSLGAWVLMGLAVIILLGLVFSLKGAVADYLVEIRTLFNLGSVRQGERLIYNGLPWRIASLDVYSTLHNPALDGLLRVPLTQISRLSSRPFHHDEPWFPTSTGDFVMLEDGAFGPVALQTPELVQLNLGESIASYRTTEFLDKRPQNLSVRGFSVGTDFGIDHRHQAKATSEILELYRSELQTALAQMPFAQYNTFFNVEFKAASSNSLDFRVGATFTAGAADSYHSIQRWLQKASVDCANKYGWEIPFPQIRVHQPVEPAPPARPQLDEQPHDPTG